MSARSMRAQTATAAPPEASAVRPARRVLSPGRRRVLLNLASFAGLILIWFALSGLGPLPPMVAPLFLPSPASVFATFVTLMRDGYQGQSLAVHLGVSLFRFATAFLISIVVAVPLGLLMGMNEVVKSLCDPPIEITRPMPKLALLPLLIIWFGIGETAKVVIIALALFPILSISAMQAVRGVGRRKIQAALSLGASRWIIFRKVILPASLPGIFTGIRVCIGLGVTMLVGAEMVATSSGIAWMALSAADFLLTNVVLVGVIIMAVLGYSLDLLARWLEGRIVHWSGKEG